MFQLRDDHITAFQEAAVDSFAERGARHLRETLPAETQRFSDDELRQRVRECIPRATRYGFRSEQEIMMFADATYLAGERFDSDPSCAWAPRLLHNPQLKPFDKARLLVVFAYDEAGRRATANQEAK
jgi:hypothetical protein